MRSCRVCGGEPYSKRARICRPCFLAAERERGRKKYARDRAAYRERTKAYAAKTKDKKLGRQRQARAVHCRACVAERHRARNRAHNNQPEVKARRRAQTSAWAKANRQRVRLYTTRRRARLRNSCSPGVTVAEWAAICEQFSDGETTWCAYCEKPATDIDHVLAINNGGLDEPDNVVPCCAIARKGPSFYSGSGSVAVLPSARFGKGRTASAKLPVCHGRARSPNSSPTCASRARSRALPFGTR